MFKKTFIFLILLFLFFAPIFSVAEAGLVPCGLSKGTPEEMSPCTLCHLILGFKNITSFGLELLITVSAVGIFIAGFMYIISSGNEEMVTKAKGFLKASLTGFIIVSMAWFFVNLTIWTLAKNHEMELVVGKKWNEFKCDTTSLVMPASPTRELIADELSDASARARLSTLGISVNAPEPRTSLQGLPETVISNLEKIKSVCGGSITITGGTEDGHKSHGQGKPVIDLRWDESLAACIKNNASTFNTTKLCTAPQDSEYRINCTYNETNQHIHIAFS